MSRPHSFSAGLPTGRHKLRRQRKLYVIVGEGATTEREYFNLFKQAESYSSFYTSPAGNHGGSPRYLLKTMAEQRRKHGPPSQSAPTEYWIVADVEAPEIHRNLSPLLTWVQQSPNNHLGLTNQQIENWLLLHFRKRIASTDPVKDLSKYIPEYSDHHKHLDGLIHLKNIQLALQNARSANVIVTDRPTQASDIPPNSTSLPHLISKLMKETT